MLISTALKKFLQLREGLSSRCRNLWFRLLGVKITGYCWMRTIEIPRDHHNIQLNACSLDRGVVLLCNGDETDKIKLSIDTGSYLNRNTFVDAVQSITIGKHVAIGPGCYITDHDHGAEPDKPPLLQPMISAPTRIEDFVWLGANVIVLKGVTIGTRTIVGAGSVVTKSLPAHSVAVGSPAKIIRTRTDS